MSSPDLQPAQPSSSSSPSPSPRPSRPARKSTLNPAVRRSSLLLAPTVAVPSVAAATIEHSYVFPSENTNGASPGGSPLNTPADLPQPPPPEPTIYEAGDAASTAEMALRERKDSEASLKKRASIFQTLGSRRSRNMSIDSGSESGSEGYVIHGSDDAVSFHMLTRTQNRAVVCRRSPLSWRRSRRTMQRARRRRPAPPPPGRPRPGS